MKSRAAVLALLVVGAGLVGVVPASAFAGAAAAQNTAMTAQDTAIESSPLESSDSTDTVVASADRTPPKLPEEWQRTYGTSGDDGFADLVRTRDGGYLLVGKTGEDTDGWVVKVDSAGKKQWAKTLGGEGTDRFRGVVRTDSGYLLAGQTSDEEGSPQGWLVAIGPDGEVRSEHTTGTGSFDAIARNEATGQFLAAGWTDGERGKTGWLVGVDADGSEEWNATVSPPEGYDDGYLRAIVPTDSGYYVAGTADGDSEDGWALKVGPEGSLEWQTTVGGPSKDDVWGAAPASSAGDSATDETNESDSGFVFAGLTKSDSDGPLDGWLVKFAPDGEVEWERKPGGEGTQWLDSALRTDEGYLFSGGSDQGPQASADGYVLATDVTGETRWESYYGTSGWDKSWPTIRAHGGGYLLAGWTSGGDAGGLDGWLVRIGASESGTTTDGTSEGTTGGETTGETTDLSAGEEQTDGGSDTNTTEESGGTTAGAMQGETATATDSPTSVPGFGVGAALVAIAALLLALRR